MIEVRPFFDLLEANGISFFAGVPDSLLKHFCAYVSDRVEPRHHIISANEGGAVAIAAGHYLATGESGLVYMQNSGLGNAINPLTSLVDPEVYAIPLLLLIGWRGEPGKKDEPQHLKQGRVTLPLLDSLGIPYAILGPSTGCAADTVARACIRMMERSGPSAILVQEGTFVPYLAETDGPPVVELSREAAIQAILDRLDTRDVVVCTTGKASREVFEYRERSATGHEKDFLTVGSMGHASHIALGIAIRKPGRQVFCLDGDGAALMHLGSWGIIGACAPGNFKHVVLNNGAHDSVGGQPTVGFQVDFTGIAKACGYTRAWKARSFRDLTELLEHLKASRGPSLLEVIIRKGSREDLGRPTVSPLKNKSCFMEFVQK